MDPESPSVVPPPPWEPPEPGSPAYRSSSAPTTSVAPPPLAPSLAWPIARIALGCAALALRGAAAFNAGSGALSAVSDMLLAGGASLAIAALPLLVPRHRSLRTFSWLFFITCFCALELTRDPILHFA